MPKGGRRAHSGRLRTPTEKKILTGQFRESRDGGQVQLPAKWPEPPAHLSERERELWNRLEGSCKTWVAESDWVALNGAVSLMDRILRIQEAQRASEDAGKPLTFKYAVDGDGNMQAEPKDNPLFTMELKFWTGLRGFIAILGLSPADRARMQKPVEEKPSNPLSRFIKGASA